MSVDTKSTPSGVRRLRRGRCSLPNHVYHVTTATRNRARVFEIFRYGRLVVDAIRRESCSGRCRTFCFVVMPDHLHWLVQVGDAGSLSDCVRNVKASSARRVNALRSRRQTLWQGGFHDHAMRHDEDLRATARYIVANPIRAGIVKRVGDYPLWDAMWI
jgi:REP element-mobilizing transposase RayT